MTGRMLIQKKSSRYQMTNGAIRQPFLRNEATMVRTSAGATAKVGVGTVPYVLICGARSWRV